MKRTCYTVSFSFAFTYNLLTSETDRGSNPGGGKIFCTRPDGPWGPHSFLYSD